MKGEGRLLRTGEYLVRRACRHLPSEVRDERYREWAAELPAILRDPAVKIAVLRAVRMLAYAADQRRGTAPPGLLRRLAASPRLRLTAGAATYGLLATQVISMLAGHGQPYSLATALRVWVLNFAVGLAFDALLRGGASRLLRGRGRDGGA